MAEKTFTTKTVLPKKSVVDDQLKPTAEMHILVGGPYKLNGEEHRYGHAAIRIKTSSADLTYDFGRYGRVTGDFGAEGEGILRIWSNFDKYISQENALKRKTKGFVFFIFEKQAEDVNKYYKNMTATAKKRTDMARGRPYIEIYELPKNYHALGYNCTTLSLDGALKAYPTFEGGSKPYIQPDGVMTFSEKIAMKTVGGGMPSRIFLPANLENFLSAKPAVKPNRIDTHGG